VTGKIESEILQKKKNSWSQVSVRPLPAASVPTNLYFDKIWVLYNQIYFLAMASSTNTCHTI